MPEILSGATDAGANRIEALLAYPPGGPSSGDDLRAAPRSAQAAGLYGGKIEVLAVPAVR